MKIHAMDELLAFLKELNVNNNRDWFNANRESYIQNKLYFEKQLVVLINKIGEIDEPILRVNPAECTFRIYRDVRFSNNKLPYKTHIGAYIAWPGGRKSERAGYYLHIDPINGCFFSTGIWSPRPDVLKKLRQSVYDNYDEFQDIIENKQFVQYFGNSIFNEESLKKIPAGFSSDFPKPELLKLKHYMVSYTLSEEFLCNDGFINKLAQIAAIAYPLNRFLNYSIDENIHF